MTDPDPIPRAWDGRMALTGLSLSLDRDADRVLLELRHTTAGAEQSAHAAAGERDGDVGRLQGLPEGMTIDTRVDGDAVVTTETLDIDWSAPDQSLITGALEKAMVCLFEEIYEYNPDAAAHALESVEFYHDLHTGDTDQ